MNKFTATLFSFLVVSTGIVDTNTVNNPSWVSVGGDIIYSGNKGKISDLNINKNIDRIINIQPFMIITK